MSPLALLLWAGAWSAAVSGGTEGPRAARTAHRAAIHVHSNFSNGALSVHELAELASRRGIDVLVLTDSFLTRVTYGVWPLDRTGIPGLNRHHRPAVLDHGVRRFLDEVAAVGRRFPEVVVVPGVEVAPHYSWTGRPGRDLTLHGFDRHLWVAGLPQRDLELLPVVGNERLGNTRPSWRRLWPPVVVLGIAVALLRVKRERPVRSGRSAGTRPVRYRKTAGCLFGVAAVLLWNHWPFGDFARSGEGPDDALAHQGLIDFVRERGGVSYWSYPEASYPDVRVGGARMVSAPHAEDLLRTDGYDGFEGLYPDHARATEPGGIWDRALLAYLRGQRVRPPYVVTGINFHGPAVDGDAWSDLDGGTTFVMLSDKSEHGVVEALRGGHAYATFMGLPHKFALESFAVETADGRRGSHGDHIAGASPVTVELVLDWTGDAPAEARRFEIEWIVDGRVERVLRQPLPVETRFQIELAPGRHYLRARAEAGRENRLLTNPVFIDVR